MASSRGFLNIQSLNELTSEKSLCHSVCLSSVCLSVSLYEHSHLDLARSPNRRKALRRFGELAVNIHTSGIGCEHSHLDLARFLNRYETS